MTVHDLSLSLTKRAGPTRSTQVLVVLAWVSWLWLGATAAFAQSGFPVPDNPPRASLIQISVPSAANDVTVTGLPGSVRSLSSVALVNLDSWHVAHTQAAPDGSWSAVIFGPRGTHVLVKEDITGVAVNQLARDIQQGFPGPASTAVLSALPGTILRVAEPATPGAITFGGAGLSHGPQNGISPLPAWTFTGTVDTQAVPLGGSFRVQGMLTMVSSALVGAAPIRVDPGVKLVRVSGPDGAGALAENTYASIFLTPTGLPIERKAKIFTQGLDRAQSPLALETVTPGLMQTAVDITFPVPPDLLAGFYRPRLDFNFFIEPVPAESPPSRPLIFNDSAQRRGDTRSAHFMHLPVIRVGSPAPPRVYWTLLTNTLAQGTRGLTAREDRGRFGIASRIATQSETYTVPRLDPSSGHPLTYRLEPFAPTIAVADRDQSAPPLIPFHFPSGSLTVRIQRPDGSTQTIGPAPFVQSRVYTPHLSDGFPVDIGGGHMTDVYQLSTMDPRFEVEFSQDGRHVITLDGSIEDVWGHVWTGGGTYDVHVARTLALDTAVLPGTVFEVGDTLSPGLVLSPPAPADVEVRFRLAPDSDPSRMVERVVRGRANRFGYFQPAAGSIPLDQQGEYRMDVTAQFRDEHGAMWMGSRTWGGVVAPRTSGIQAHGRRGIDSQAAIGQQWFFRTQTGQLLGSVGGSHLPYPFHSGDVTWAQKSDASIPWVTFQDLTGSLIPLLRERAFASNGQSLLVRLPGPGSFDERAVVGEAPLFSSRSDERDPHLDPALVDLWAYSYRSVQRPLVRVREEVAEDTVPSPYWRFVEQYGAQIGVGISGDLPNDIKFQYGAAVLRGPAIGQPLYAIHGSLFVLVPDSDPQGGSRTFPPFQGNGGGPSGGPIMTLKGRPIDLFIHLTGVRPGSVLEVGDTFSLVGAVGPPLPARLGYTITKPDGQQVAFSGRANQVGYYYHPEHDVLADQPGLWRVDLRATYEERTSAGQVTSPFPSGDVLGTADGRFFVYVVPRGSAPLEVNLPATAVLPPPANFAVSATPPPGMTLAGGHLTAMMPGFVLDSRALPGGQLAYTYDPVSLAHDFPNLDVMGQRFPGGPAAAADAVTLTLFATGTASDGSPAYAARVLVLHGPERFTGLAQSSTATLLAAVLPASRSVPVGTPATAFATLINIGPVPATGCGIAPLGSLPLQFVFHATDPFTNQVIGGPNVRVDIPSGGAQSFVFAITPTAPIAPGEFVLLFACANASPAPVTAGLNTLLLSASTTAGPDIVALAVTPSQDGIVNLPGAGGTGVFAVAAVNVGAGGLITASADTGSALVPVVVMLCQTNPTTAQCISPPGPTVTTQIDAGATPTFSAFVTGSGVVSFDPATNRVFMRFKDAGGVTRGATSVAARTQ